MRVVEGTAVNTDSDLASVLSPLCGSPRFTLKNPGKEFQGGKVWFPKCGPWTSHTSITSEWCYTCELLQMQVLRPHQRAPDSETLGMGPEVFVLINLTGNSNAC